MAIRWAALFLAVGLAGCGPSTDTSSDGGPITGDQSLLPMEVGRTWSYRVTYPGGGFSAEKTTTVTGRQAMDGAKAGVEAFVVQSVTGASSSRVFIEVKDGLVLRHREDGLVNGSLAESKVLTPASLRGVVDLPEAGKTWTEHYTEAVYDSKGALISSKENDYTWRVESVAEQVTVPAGTFTCVRLSRIKAGSGKDKTYWLAPGVGKVKEDDAGIIEVLTAWQAP